jgi:hypothetical protein
VRLVSALSSLQHFDFGGLMEAQKWSVFRFSKPFERWKISSKYTLGEVISFAGEKESAVARLDALAQQESGDAVELCLFGSSVHDLAGLILVARCVTKKTS